MNADGKIIAVQICLNCEGWDVALEYAEGLAESDFACAPALAYLAALVNLVQAVPLELRMIVLQPPPFDAAQFPLAGHHKAIEFRRKAQELYEKTAKYATELGLDKVANISADAALWLALRDLERSTLARAELEKSMRDTSDSLRRLPLALQFGLNIDLVAVEREIERKTTLSAGKSTDAAVARLALAFMQETPRKVLEYIDRHRAQLVERLNPKAIGFFEIEMLVRSGQQKIARERIEELNSVGLTEPERSRLLKMVEEATGTDPVEQSLALYEMSKSLTDLHGLVIAFESPLVS